jgi:thioredoxin-dependent peroxiredoxin
MIEEGSAAPSFTVPNQDGRLVSLDDYRGRAVVLYFYPEAGSSGCTAQACGVRDHAAAYDAAGAVILGVSPDPVEKIRRFADEHGLRFSLLSDEHAVAEAYGVWIEKSIEGRRFWGNERTTFVIGADGILRAVQPRDHDDLVLAAMTRSRQESP